MNRIVKTAAVSALVAVTALTAALPANAGERWRHRDRGNGGDVVAAGVLGLAAGALIAGSANNRPVYGERYYDGGYAPRPVYQRPVRVYEERRPVYVERYATFEPWTRDWYRYCSDRYRSFDPDTGTFVGYDGVRRFCEAN
ncbi:BA14K family protein [Aliihoeflea sp. 40Bstr573]|uniref:BA14K family protein n=1 Tax=Aliihoeflea sp. 40Bstr573 TaxID=2696467 RepID=UPI002096273C|nr:BA14K family protein [Aliihoeflea sp. 40Bstr573]MCO6387660.1 BA14K family protein [Aliihoeflea sp. 40Bstr573]